MKRIYALMAIGLLLTINARGEQTISPERLFVQTPLWWKPPPAKAGVEIRGTSAATVLVFLTESLHAPLSPDDQRISVTVIRITESAVERHVVDVADTGPGSGPGFYTPIEGQIYANYPDLGGLSKWAGDHFVAATDEERKRLSNIDHLTLPEHR
jgi:hypothetical protein